MTMDKQLYDTDFCLWIDHNVSLLRQGNLQDIDIENIAEELESIGKNNKRELLSRLIVLIMHLLKCKYQKNRKSKSWLKTIDTQRFKIRLVLEDSPSLKHNIDLVIEKAYKEAKHSFEKETGLSKDTLPIACPYTFDELMNS